MGEEVGQIRIWEGVVVLWDKLVLFEFLVVETGIVGRRVG